jgi:hypothetical protein
MPSEEPVDQPVGQPIGQPIEQPVGQPIEQPIEQPVGQPVGQPIEQPVEGGGEAPIERRMCVSADEAAMAFEQQAGAVGALTEQVQAAAAAARADHQGLSANLTVRGNLDTQNTLANRSAIEEVGGDVREGFALHGAALAEISAKTELLVGGDSPGLSDIYAATLEAAQGGDNTCANACAGRGICRFGQCFASAGGVANLDNKIQDTTSTLQAALDAQSELSELNQSAVQADFAALRTKALRSEARALLTGDPGNPDLSVSLEVAALVVAMAEEDHTRLIEVRVRGRKAQRRARHAAAVLTVAQEDLEAGQPIGAVVAANIAYRLNAQRRGKLVLSHTGTWNERMDMEGGHAKYGDILIDGVPLEFD